MFDISQTSWAVLSVWLILWGIYMCRLIYTTHGRAWVSAFAILALLAIVIESVWVATCFPYECFSYAHIIQPEIWSIPAMLPFFWLVLVLSLRSISQQYFWDSWPTWNIVRSIVGTTALLVLIDLALDPVHVALGIWSYGYGVNNIWWRYDVPRSNYLWRVLTGTISAGICAYFLRTNWNKKLHPLFGAAWRCMLGLFWGAFLVGVVW